jgi:cell volume regulation protein A
MEEAVKGRPFFAVFMDSWEEPAMHSHTLELAQDWLFSLLILFIAGTLMSKAAQRLRLPDVAQFLLAGIALGPQALGFVDLPANSTANQLVLLFGACLILFHGGTITSLGVLQRTWVSITLLSTVGVAVTAFVMAGTVAWLFGVPMLTALLLGAILASTDPAALVPIFQKFPIRPNVAQTVITESAFTDVTGAIMTTVVFGIIASGTSAGGWAIVWQFAQLALGGIVVGGIVGYAAAFLISENDLGLLKEYTPMVTVLTVLAGYLLVEKVHASGFMAVFAAGLAVGNASRLGLTVLPKQEQAAHEFLDTISLKLRMFILSHSAVKSISRCCANTDGRVWRRRRFSCLLPGRSRCWSACFRIGKRHGADEKFCSSFGRRRPALSPRRS